VKIGINGSNMLAKPNLDAILDHIADSEAAGFSSYWLAQGGLTDAPTTFSLAGARTSTIELGTAVVPTWEIHPHALAAKALTTSAATAGRFTLGIGLSHEPSVEGRLHQRWERPIRHINDYLEVLQPILDEGRSSHEGEIWSYTGGGRGPASSPPSVMLAALGAQMLRIAGRRTDGTILWCVGPRTIESHIRPIIDEAANAAGRQRPRVVCSVPVWVTDDPSSATSFIAKSLKFYAALPSYRSMLDIEGVEGVESISLIGSEQQIVDGLGRIADAGASDFSALVLASDASETDRTLAALAGFS
jgi:5,10-methylenetetrahydromethanopterin reductase